MTDTWRPWVAQQMERHGWSTQADVIRGSNLTRSAISQWLDTRRNPTPTVENCRRAAEVFGVPTLAALVAAGHLTPEEAGQPPALPVDLAEVPTLDLLDELKKRAQRCEPESARVTPRKPLDTDHAHQTPGTRTVVDQIQADTQDSTEQPTRRTRRLP
jgi:transcriptional regulator with XRE-family HTH domain